jgi:hypothetical protein
LIEAAFARHGGGRRGSLNCCRAMDQCEGSGGLVLAGICRVAHSLDGEIVVICPARCSVPQIVSSMSHIQASDDGDETCSWCCNCAPHGWC